MGFFGDLHMSCRSNQKRLSWDKPYRAAPPFHAHRRVRLAATRQRWAYSPGVHGPDRALSTTWPGQSKALRGWRAPTSRSNSLGSAATTTVTPTYFGAGGTFTPSPVALPAGAVNPGATFTYRPATIGSITITTTNARSLSDPAGLIFTSKSTSGATAYDELPGPLLFAWSGAGQISGGYGATGDWADIERSSDGSTETFALSAGIPPFSSISGFLQGGTGTVTKLYSEDPSSNNAITFSGRNAPQIILNDYNGNACLRFAHTGGNDTGLATPASINDLSGASIFSVAEVPSVGGNAGDLAVFANQLYYPNNNGVLSEGWIAPTAASAMSANNALHAYYATIQMGDIANGLQTFVDGSRQAVGPSVDALMPVTSALDIGFLRWYEPAGFYGDVCELVVSAGAAGPNDISRAHALDRSNWGTP